MIFGILSLQYFANKIPENINKIIPELITITYKCTQKMVYNINLVKYYI